MVMWTGEGRGSRGPPLHTRRCGWPPFTPYLLASYDREGWRGGEETIFIPGAPRTWRRGPTSLFDRTESGTEREGTPSNRVSHRLECVSVVFTTQPRCETDPFTVTRLESGVDRRCSVTLSSGVKTVPLPPLTPRSPIDLHVWVSRDHNYGKIVPSTGDFLI